MDYSRLTGPSPIVLLAGAGASAAFGMPTMLQFRENFGAQMEPNNQGLWKALVDAAAESKDIDQSEVNIEHIFTHIENCEKSFTKASNLWKKLYHMEHGEPDVAYIHNFRQHLWKLRLEILEGIVIAYGSAEIDIDKVVACYDPLFEMFKRVSGQRLTHVFTINYDSAFECLAHNPPGKYEVQDGFSNSPSLLYGLDYVPQCKTDYSLVLYKMHGSLSWEYIQKTANIQRNRPAHR